jgi:hypothetical protein
MGTISGVVLAGSSARESVTIIAELAQHSRAEDFSQTRLAAINRCGGMLGEQHFNLAVESVDLLVERGDDRAVRLHDRRVAGHMLLGHSHAVLAQNGLNLLRPSGGVVSRGLAQSRGDTRSR